MNYTASGKGLLPEAVSLTVKPSGMPGLYRLVYTETLPTRDKDVLQCTLEMCRSLLPDAKFKIANAGKRDTKFTIRATAPHAMIGAMLAGEFLCWSPLGTLSIMECAIGMAIHSTRPKAVATPTLAPTLARSAAKRYSANAATGRLR